MIDLLVTQVENSWENKNNQDFNNVLPDFIQFGGSVLEYEIHSRLGSADLEYDLHEHLRIYLFCFAKNW